MTRTAYDEFYGVGIDTAISANYSLRLPYGPGGARAYVLRPSAPGLLVILPIAPFCTVGQKFTVANHGSQALTIIDVIGTPVVASLAVGDRAQVWLQNNGSIWGVWVSRVTSSALGTALVHNREPLEVLIDSWIGNGINLRTYCEDRFGYDGVLPASIYCRIFNVVVGSETTSEPAFDTGEWPSGSTLLLELGNSFTQIVGRGGDGGRGQDVPPGLLAEAGGTGGDALVVRVNTNLVNYGTISGGGGGGGGGLHGSGVGGGGGGGGAGYQSSVGGAGGSPGGQAGQGGNISIRGLEGNGGNTGGSGGQAGQSGGNGNPGGTGGAFGAAGNAIKRLTTATLTKIVAGTINGPEVTF